VDATSRNAKADLVAALKAAYEICDTSLAALSDTSVLIPASIFAVSGEGEQMVDDAPAVHLRPGASIFIPGGVFHSTLNTGWEPLRFVVVYAPAGPERLLREIPGCKVVPA
jgi:hypothetical protein